MGRRARNVKSVSLSSGPPAAQESGATGRLRLTTREDAPILSCMVNCQERLERPLLRDEEA
jgi:hypothetical protein